MTHSWPWRGTPCFLICAPEGRAAGVWHTGSPPQCAERRSPAHSRAPRPLNGRTGQLVAAEAAASIPVATVIAAVVTPIITAVVPRGRCGHRARGCGRRTGRRDPDARHTGRGRGGSAAHTSRYHSSRTKLRRPSASIIAAAAPSSSYAGVQAARARIPARRCGQPRETTTGRLLMMLGTHRSCRCPAGHRTPARRCGSKCPHPRTRAWHWPPRLRARVRSKSFFMVLCSCCACSRFCGLRWKQVSRAAAERPRNAGAIL